MPAMMKVHFFPGCLDLVWTFEHNGQFTLAKQGLQSWTQCTGFLTVSAPRKPLTLLRVSLKEKTRTCYCSTCVANHRWKTITGSNTPRANFTRRTVDKCCVVVAERTIRNTIAAKGLLNHGRRLVTRMNTGMRRLRVYWFAAWLADVEEAAYSPPVPKPTMPRDIGSTQNIPLIYLPWDAVARASPLKIRVLVVTIATFLPRWS